MTVLKLPNDVISSYIGNGAPMLFRRSLGDPDDENFVQEALLYFLSYYREHKLDTTYVYAGIKESPRRHPEQPPRTATQDGRPQ